MSLKKAGVWLGQAAVLFILGYYLIYRNIIRNWNSLATYDWDLRWLPFLVSLIAVSLVFALNSQIWRMMVLTIGGVRVRRFRAAYVWFVSNLGRYLPGKVWQIAGMAFLVRRDGVPALDALSSMVLNQVITLLSGAAVGLIFLPDNLPGLAGEMIRWAWLALPVMLACLYPPLLNRLLRLAARLTGKEEVSCRLRFRDVLLWFALLVIVWLAYGASFYYFIRAIVPEAGLSIWDATGIYSIGYIIGFLALFAPGGIGVREGLFTLLLTGPMGQVKATVVALVSRVWLTLAEMVPLALVILIGGLPGGDKTTEAEKPK